MNMARRRKKTRRSKSGWNPVRHPGSLKAVGYDPDYSDIARHRALSKAVKRYGYAETVRKIGFLAGAARIPTHDKRAAKEDLNWLKERFGKKRRRR